MIFLRKILNFVLFFQVLGERLFMLLALHFHQETAVWVDKLVALGD